MALLGGPLLAVEQGLWEKLGRSPAGAGPEGPALAAATAAALRDLASTCVRAAMLCGGGGGDGGNDGEDSQAAADGQAWEAVRPRVLAVRNRWASAAVKSGSAAVAARVGAGSTPLEATATLALSTAVLSGFLAATPLMPSGEEGMRLMPARIRGALVAEAEARRGPAAEEATAAAAAAAAVAVGWARAQAAASLAWLRDCAEATTRVHVSPSAGSLDSQIFLDTQDETEGAVVALVSPASTAAGRTGRAAAAGGGSEDLALARACGGLFAGESYRLSRGHLPSLSCESKAAVVSWAVSKFLLSGGRMASGGGSGDDDDVALCLETARLLTAVAWDGREGWGGGGGGGARRAAPPYHALIDVRADRSRVWEAARSPAVWRGLHAAVVGAVASPALQLCAFEVLEAAAADWRCGVAISPLAEEEGGGGGDGAAESKGAREARAGSEGGSEDGGGGAAPEAGAQSIVSRLARALGGWGLASTQGGGASGGAGGGGGGGDADADREGLGGGGGDRMDLSGSEAVQEEAREQQDDLELIAK